MTWRLIIDPAPLKGSLNMAVDEHLFRSAAREGRTYVRFYRWERPTVSLGYSQDVGKVLDLDFCRRNEIDVVRRITGGKLVLHHREVTYSVSSAEREVFSSNLTVSYRLISQALIRGLDHMGLDARLAGAAPSFYARGHMPCFSQAARDEIEVGGKKIVGSAQKRIGSHFLQHGSIPLEADEDLLRNVSLLKGKDDQVLMTSLSEALGRVVTFDWAVDHLAAGISEFFQGEFKAWSIPRRDMPLVREIQKTRYDNPAWTLEREEGRSLDFSGAE
jgi:lipoate-protein ligase A